MGGRSSSSAIDGPGLPGPGLPVRDPLLLGGSRGKVGVEYVGIVPDLIRDRVRGVIGWPARGDAVIMVPGAAIGAGFGLVERNRGCTSSSNGEVNNGLSRWREVGLEKFGGLDGGDERLALRELLGIQSAVVAMSDDAAWGDEGRKGPSRALAGESGLLPGIVGRPVLITDGEG